MENHKDFYQFLKFAEAKLPPRATFNLLTGPDYIQSAERAQYYLYPRIGKAPADYLLIIDANPGKKIWQDFKLLAKFRDGAYILKRK